MESGCIRRGFDLAVVPGGDPVVRDPGAPRAQLLASHAGSGATLRGLAIATRVISSRLKFGILAPTCLAVGLLMQTSARAENAEEALARVQVLEKEIAAIKKENEALRRVKELREQNATLVKQTATTNNRSPSALLPTRQEPREAYAADLPIYAKVAAPVERGQFRVWGEGGAIWSGGDPIDSFYTRSTVSFVTGVDTRLLFFPLLPKVGWEAATGFDYRFAGSPWHVSGQFRYGEGRTSVISGSSSSDSFSAGGGPPSTVTLTDAESVAHKETHWLADLALGRDVIGSGADAMQFKFGMRMAELRATTNSRETVSESLVGSGNDFFIGGDTNVSQQLKFLGAGPRFGVEGSVPMLRGWTFDYLGDVAALFGTQNFRSIASFDNEVVIPNPGGLSLAPPVVNTAQKFATVLNADIQVGVSYWFSQNVKASLSYRLDAFFNAFTGLDAQNDPKNLAQINRYIHGPRLAVSAQF
jgi:hypothetical protein